MIEALEKLLRDLEQNFEQFGIVYTAGQEFDMTQFGLDKPEDSRLSFYDPEHCDGINNNPELQANIAESGNWVNANSHQYPKNIGRALYNSTLRALWMTKNPGSAAPGIKTHKEYIDNNHRYIDNQKVETRGPVGDGIPSVSLTRAPLIVDPISETFGQSYKQFLNVMAKNTDPFKDAKDNCWVPGGAAMMDAGTPKTIAGFQTTLYVLNERLATYHARKNENILNDQTFFSAATTANEKTNNLTQSARNIENKYDPFFNKAAQIESRINSTKLSEMNIKQKEQFIKETIAELEVMKKNAITQEAIQHDIDTLTNQYRTISNENTVALPLTPSYQAGLYQGHDVSHTFHSAESDATQHIKDAVLKLKRYKNNLAQIVEKQEKCLKKLQNELIETSSQLINKIEAIRFSVSQLDDLAQHHRRLSLESTQFDDIAKRITWDDEITQLALLKKRLKSAKDQLAAHDANTPIDETLFKELSQILAWSPNDIEQWGYVTKPAGYFESSMKMMWSALSSLSLANAEESRTESLTHEINARLQNISIDPIRKKTELEIKASTVQSELTATEDSLSLLQKYFGENGQANTYLNQREKEYAFFDNVQAMTKIFRREPSEKEKRRNFFSEIGAHVKNYEQDRNPEHLRLALNKINALKKKEQFKPRADYKKSMRAVLGALGYDITLILSKNNLHTQYFSPENGKIGVFLDILRKNEHWKHSRALSDLEAINASMKEYGHDDTHARSHHTLNLVNELLTHWNERAPVGYSHVNQMKHTLESLKTELEKQDLVVKYLGTEGVFDQFMKHHTNEPEEAKVQRIGYLTSVGELMEQYAQDKNPQDLVKLHEKIDAVTQEGGTLFAGDRAKGQQSIQTILTELKVELIKAYGPTANRVEPEPLVRTGAYSGSPRMAMAD